MLIGDDLPSTRVTHLQQLEVIDVVRLERFVPHFERYDAAAVGMGIEQVDVACLE